jgi:CDP-diacylglycerol--glycerol-3-phosphate 3-phosphatidyltransferase
LTSPEQFKATLLAMIKRAKRRILISSLYIGAGQSELVRRSSVALSRE